MLYLVKKSGLKLDQSFFINNLHLQCGQEFLNLIEAMGSVVKLLKNRWLSEDTGSQM